MEINGIHYFICAAELLSFTKAAEECFITQTAMSQHIQSMEKELGFQLFNRSTRKMELTPAGREFYLNMKALYHNYYQSVDKSRSLANGVAGHLTIEVGSIVEGMVFAPRFKKIQDLLPSVQIRIRVVHPYKMIDHLKHNKCDITIGFPYEPESDKDIQTRFVSEFRDYLMVNRDSPLLHFPLRSLSDIREGTLVLPDWSKMPNTQRFMQQRLKELSLGEDCRIESENIYSLDEITLFVSINRDAFSIVPEYVVGDLYNNVVVLSQGAPNLKTSVTSLAFSSHNDNPVIPQAVSCICDTRIPLSY